MIRVGSPAPPFDGTAVVDGRLVSMRWQQMHEDKTLVLLFDPVHGTEHSPDYLMAVSNAVARRVRPNARVAVIWRHDAHAALAWANRPAAEGGPGVLAFPLIVDPAGHIAAKYGLSPPALAPIWSQIFIDPAGVIRQVVVTGVPVYPSIDDLLRTIQAIGSEAGGL